MKLHEELIKLLTQYPDLPIYKEYENDSMYDDGRLGEEIKSVSVEEALTWRDKYYWDKEEFKQDYYDYYVYEYAAMGLSEEERENKINEACDAQDWKRVILIR